MSLGDIFSGIGDYFTGAGVKKASEAQAQALQTGLAQMANQYTAGRQGVTDWYTNALQPYQSIQGTGISGMQAYADATGANGPEGYARAAATFQGSPGLAFAQREAQNAVERSGVAGGRATGNILDQVGRTAQGLGLQNWNNYVSSLQPWLGQAQGTAAGLSGVYQGGGNQIGQLYANQANQYLPAYQGIGQAKAQGEMAGTIGAGNLINAGLAVGGMIAGGGLGGVGGLLGGLGSTLGKSSLFGNAAYAANPLWASGGAGLPRA